MTRTTILILTLALVALTILGMLGNMIASEMRDSLAPLTTR